MRSMRTHSILALLLLTGCPDLPDGMSVDTSSGIAGESDPDVGIPEEVLQDLPPCPGSVLGAFTEDEVQPPAADSGGWMAPEADTLAAIEASAEALLNGLSPIALGQTAVVGYQMCRGTGEEGRMVLWRPAQPGTGRGLFAWRVGEVSALIIEAPHAWASPATMEQAVTLFRATQARVLIASGSHPCSNPDVTGCGADTLCGGDIAPASNPSQNEDTVFHVAHTMFTDRFPQDWVVSIVPMDDEGVSVSDGTRGPASLGSAAEEVALALMDALTDEPVTSCNDFPGAIVQDRACGAESVQARQLNGAVDACSAEDLDSTGRFVQISESPTVQQRGLTVADAIATALSTR